jgi:hypothetical protein
MPDFIARRTSPTSEDISACAEPTMREKQACCCDHDYELLGEDLS